MTYSQTLVQFTTSGVWVTGGLFLLLIDIHIIRSFAIIKMFVYEFEATHTH